MYEMNIVLNSMSLPFFETDHITERVYACVAASRLLPFSVTNLGSSGNEFEAQGQKS